MEPPSIKEFKGLFLKLSRLPEVHFMCMATNAQIYITEIKIVTRNKACCKGFNQCNWKLRIQFTLSNKVVALLYYASIQIFGY